MFLIMFFVLFFHPTWAITCSPVTCETFETDSSECLNSGSIHYIQECTDSEYTCPHPSNAESGTNLECEYWSDLRIWEADSWQEFYQFTILDEDQVCDPYGLVSVCDQDLVCYCTDTCTCRPGLEEDEYCYGVEIPCIEGYVCSNKVCTLKYSLQPGEASTNALACSSGGPLVATSKEFVCRQPPMTPGELPKECNSDNDCVSDDGSEYTECVCGMNSDGVAYCGLHYGDEPMAKLREAERDKDFEAEIYWKFQTVNWPYLQGNLPPCLNLVWRDYGKFTLGLEKQSNGLALVPLAMFLIY